MSFSLRKALRENVTLLIGLAGGTGSGKTYTAMRLAAGIAGDKPFAVIDTEAGRAKHYADQFNFDHGDLLPPFRPTAYEEAILATDKAGYPVIVVDSMSHEHAGEGGLLEWQEEELSRMVQRAMQKNPNASDYQLRESMAAAAWIKPKGAHKHMMQRLLQIRAHLILCFRAEDKIEFAKVDGKTVVRPKQSPAGKDGWIPVCEKRLPFELTASFLLLASEPGLPKPIKLQEQHRALFPLDKPITEDSGRRIAQWAAGAAPDWARDINAASTKEALAAVWARIPRSDQATFAAVKDARKKVLEQPGHCWADMNNGTVAQSAERGGSLRVGDSATGAGSIPAGSSNKEI